MSTGGTYVQMVVLCVDLTKDQMFINLFSLGILSKQHEKYRFTDHFWQCH